MNNKLALFYKVDRGSIQTAENALLEIAPQIQRRISAEEHASVRVMALVEGAADKTPHVTSMGYASASLNASIEFGYDEAPLHSLIQIAGAALPPIAQIADAQSSCALVGREYVFCPGEGPYTLRVFMGRSLDTSFEHFHSHWLNRHGWLVKPRVDSRKGAYRQFHADPKASSLAARVTRVGRHDFEGAAESYQPDVDTYLQSMSRTGSAILDDEKRFMSAPDTEVGFYRIVLDLK
jgi:EthD domain-containing protein